MGRVGAAIQALGFESDLLYVASRAESLTIGLCLIIGSRDVHLFRPQLQPLFDDSSQRLGASYSR